MRVHKKKLAESSAEELASSGYRMDPISLVLQRRVQIPKADIWVPVLPDVNIPEVDAESGDGTLVTWRKHAFDQAHRSFLNPHRPPGPTYQNLKRMAYWPGMHKDKEIWLNECRVCHQYRTTARLAPMRSTLGSLNQQYKIPWRDVIIDCQGPFTKSAEGKCYVVSYHCTFLGIPKLEPFASLTKEDFLNAMVTCMFRARRIPDIVRTDRGPEMTSAIMEEFLACLLYTSDAADE